MNKNLWSPSFVLLTAGLAAALFGLTWWLVDVRGVRGWTGPFVTYGKNAIAVYVGSEVLSGRPRHDRVGLGRTAGSEPGRSASTSCAFASWLPPMLAAFAFALANVVLWWAVARWMDRRGIYLEGLRRLLDPHLADEVARRRPPPTSPTACSARPRGSTGC